MNRAAALAVFGVTVVAGCELERSEGLGDGQIHMVVVDDAGDPVAGALVSVIGNTVGALSGDDGAAVVKTILSAGDYAYRVTIDDNGDGVADRAAVGGDATVRVGEVRGLDRLTAFILDHDVVLETAGSVSGTVAGCDDGELCRVVAFRRIELGSALSATREVALPIEGQSGVQSDGSWRIEGLAPGEVELVALAAPVSTSVEPRQQLIAASQPVRFGRATADVGSSAIGISVDTAVPESVSATIELAGADAVGQSGRAFINAPSDSFLLDGGGDIAAIADDSRAVQIDVPVSVFDIAAQLEGFQGDLRAVVGVPDIGLLLPTNPVLKGCDAKLPDDNDPAGTVYCDADGDGLLDADPAEDDADGDGIADADEVGCVGINVGTDADGDCLCDLIDPFPGCSSNDPADCTRAVPVTCGE